MSAVPEPEWEPKAAATTTPRADRAPIAHRHLWSRYWAIARPYWVSGERWKALGMLVLVILLLLVQTRTNVMFIEQSGEFTSALAAQDTDRFWDAIEQCLYITLVAVPSYGLYYYTRNSLGLFWRQWLTRSYLDGYFKDRTYYKLEAQIDTRVGIDNPDQRISEDINTFTSKSLFFLAIGIGALLQLVAFSAVLWSISHALVYFLFVYTVAGTFITVFFFGRVLIGLNYYQLKREADFRFSLIRIRENAESIAFYRGEPMESSHVHGRFRQAFQNYRKILRKQLHLNLFQSTYSSLTIVLPSAIVASRVLSGELEVGHAIAAAGAFTAILNAMAVIIDNFEDLSRFVAGLDRLDTFANAITRAAAPAATAAPAAPATAGTAAIAPIKPAERIEFIEKSRLSLQHVTLCTPNRERTLVEDLSVSVNPGDGLLIVGASGRGKSSVMRAIAGLWTSGTGYIIRPSQNDMLFLPQRPYMVIGNLRSQLVYPNLIDRPVADDELLRLLDMVNLGGIVGRFGGLDTEVDWSKVLSLGEQQRLTIARVMLSKPRYVMLDEATSALDIGNEEHMYQLLADMQTTLVSVSHRPSLLKYHNQVLELSGEGGWKILPTKGYQFR